MCHGLELKDHTSLLDKQREPLSLKSRERNQISNSNSPPPPLSHPNLDPSGSRLMVEEFGEAIPTQTCIQFLSIPTDLLFHQAVPSPFSPLW
ncbi:hypothetical protein RchiOBHm_Chr1g0346401 [Rosa chinensis]|uniref:Uncharacterized protein n=1 Tax=Rosa chinensis TaxID=74649 RepID=A0A2P6SF02_ROSCH|nr:hypothetical protein RchiOBHm_Chr1g0346401 [Rosa chinensis]